MVYKRDVANAVLQLMRERTRQGSTPRRRSDDARLVLLVEGGSSRGAYSSGMTIAIEQLGLLPLFDAVYGSSAGALNAAWLLCGRAKSTMHAWWDPKIMGATIDPRRALRRQPVVDTRFLVHTVYTEIMPMGRMNLPPLNAERCVRYVEISAALLLALWDRCQVEVPDA